MNGYIALLVLLAIVQVLGLIYVLNQLQSAEQQINVLAENQKRMAALMLHETIGGMVKELSASLKHTSEFKPEGTPLQ